MSTPEIDVGAVYRRYVTLVRGRARRLVGGEGEDLTQETFVRFLQYRRRGEHEDNTAHLLCRIATNLGLNRLRDARRRARLLDDDLPASPVAAAAPLDDQIMLRQVLALVDAREAEVAVHYYLEGMEQEEIGCLLNLPRRTVGRRLEAFRASARKSLRPRFRSEVSNG